LRVAFISRGLFGDGLKTPPFTQAYAKTSMNVYSLRVYGFDLIDLIARPEAVLKFCIKTCVAMKFVDDDDDDDDND